MMKFLISFIIAFFLNFFSIRNDSNLFHKKFYREWRKLRILKLLKIFNIDNKKILELGSATGAVGRILQKLGGWECNNFRL
jgi:hypothetical protein